MKVIDLLNKIANTDKLPEYIKYFNRISNKEEKMLVCKENIIYKLDQLEICLNDEVEIIEEPKKIEKIVFNNDGDIVYYENGEKHRFTTNKQTKYLAHKLNEIINCINNN